MVSPLANLAQGVALSFATSSVAPGVASALEKLLPGLAYASVVVSNPSQRRWSLVGASNFARAGPTTLALSEPRASAAGLALRSGKLVQCSLFNGARSFAQQLGDVVSLLEAAPDAKLMLCMPLKADQERQHGGRVLHGALLLGLNLDYCLSKRQLAALMLLAQLLPSALYRACAATDVLEAVDYMTGAAAYECPCCASDEEEDSDVEEDSDEEDAGPCKEDGAPPPDHPPPTQPLLVPSPFSAASGGQWDCGGQHPGSGCCARCASASCPKAAPGASGKQDSSNAAAVAAGVALGDAADSSVSGSSSWGGHACAPSCSKPGTEGSSYQAEEGGPGDCTPSAQQLHESSSVEDLDSWASSRKSLRSLVDVPDRRHPVWMTFMDPLLEQEFLKWHSSQQIKIDMLFTLLLVAALCIVGFCHPFKLVERNPWGLLLGCVLLAPLPLALLNRKVYIMRRERIVVMMRLLTVAFINLISIPSYQAFVVGQSLSRVATFWMLTGAESLLITALGLQVRVQLQLPLQFACLATAAWHVPSMCSVCYPGLTAIACQARSMRVLVGAGLVLPSAVLRFVEGKSRMAFLEEIQASAA